MLCRGDDASRLNRLAALAGRHGTPLVATNDVHYHLPARRALQDVLTAIRERVTVARAGRRLAANAERHLKSAAEMARLFRGHEDALARTLEIVALCAFSLDELAWEYPDEPVPAGRTPQRHLEALARDGAARRYPGGVPDRVRATLARELALIAELDYAPYFLTVHDIVRFARERGILCQGRGSAANSVVCYCLGITAVDPTQIDLLFERFVSRERREPPDIDVDFEHERREEVIQYVYEPLRPRPRRPRRHGHRLPGTQRDRGTSARPWACRRTPPRRSPTQVWGAHREGVAEDNACARPGSIPDDPAAAPDRGACARTRSAFPATSRSMSAAS